MQLPLEATRTVAQLVKDISIVHEERKVLALLLRGIGSLFGCNAGSVFLYKRASDTLFKVKSLREAESWDLPTLMRFFRNERPQLDPQTIMAPIRAGRGVIGVIVLWKEAGFNRGAGKIATEILRIVGSIIGTRRDLTLSLAESAIAKGVLAGVSPKDIAYRVFHQLRRFIDYDHGAALISRSDHETGTVVARQLAWTKGRSDIVGRSTELDWERLSGSLPMIVSKDHMSRLWETLDSLREKDAPAKGSIMIDLLQEDCRLLGLVEIASKRRDFFVDSDAEILSRFRTYLSWCLKRLEEQHGGQDE